MTVPAIIVLDANVLIPNALWDREPQLITRVITEQAADTGRHGPRLTPSDVLAYLANAGAHQFAKTVQPYIPEEKSGLSAGQYSIIRSGQCAEG